MRPHSFIQAFLKLQFCAWHCAGHRNTETLPSRKMNTEINKKVKRAEVSDGGCMEYKDVQRERERAAPPGEEKHQ